MRDRFTITISDVHGAHHYSFRQVVKKFAIYIVVGFLLLWGLIALSLWWALDQKSDIEKKHEYAVGLYADRLFELQGRYEQTLLDKESVEAALTNKSQQIDLLDRKLQDIEELVMGAELPPVTDENWQERLRDLQVSTVAKQYLLEMIPSGSAVSDFKGFSSYYGMRSHPVLHQKKMHYGIDYRGALGDEVIATAEGVVMFAGNSSVGFGKMITVAHANGFKTRYGHLSKINVAVGEYVSKGQKIGEVGNTGRSTAPHLHYEVMFLSKRIDPKPFHDWNMKQFEEIFAKVDKVPWASFVNSVNQKIDQVEKQLLPPVAALQVNLPN